MIRSTFLLGIFALLALTPSCSKGSSASPALIALTAALVWNSPVAQYMVARKGTFPREIETVNLKHTGQAGNIEFNFSDPTNALIATPSSGVLTPGQEIAISIAVVTLVAYTTVTLALTAKYVGNDTIAPLTSNLAFLLMPPGMFVMALLSGDPGISGKFLAAIVFGLIGVLVQHSTAGTLRNRVPALAYTEIVLIGLLTLAMTAELLQANFWRSSASQESAVDVNFPPGQGPIGYTIHPNKEAVMQPGDFHMFHLVMRDPIPVKDADKKNRHTYAFVLDSDGNAANDFKPLPAFPNDFWKGTDRWYQIDYTDAGGWTLKVSQVDSSNNVTEVASAARAIVVNDSIVMVVPKSEVPGPGAKWRASSFVHQGDFGVGAPYLWSGDVEPTVASPLVNIK